MLAALLAGCTVMQPALATWSVVAVNTKTGEVAIASATCLANTNLQKVVPCILPGRGAGAVQSSTDLDGSQRLAIWNGMLAGKTPQEILNSTLNPGHQYGICNMYGPAVTYTSSIAGAAANGKSGVTGDIHYAIQGNVLAHKKVIGDARDALINTPGDLGQKVMAAMVAAGQGGGDGRCSCPTGSPNSCGYPPPNFTHSAYTAFVIVSRVGDTKGVCNANKGCANGNYYCDVNVISNKIGPDPVTRLQARYDDWRAREIGRPDAILSQVDVGADSLPADGLSTMPIVLRLVDIDGTPLVSGGATVWLKNLSAQADVTTPGPVVDHGDGSYSLELTAGTTVGTDQWRVIVDDGPQRLVQLFPPIAIRVDPVADLHVGRDAVSASAGSWVPLTLDPGVPQSFYRVLASASGTAPGTPFQGTTLPLNRDVFMMRLSARANTGQLPNTRGFLDDNGRADAAFVPPPGLLAPYVGSRIEWSALFFHASGLSSAAPTGFDVVP
jgi:uncharacterized Ntn-hydrolase superfamily protein